MGGRRVAALKPPQLRSHTRHLDYPIDVRGNPNRTVASSACRKRPWKLPHSTDRSFSTPCECRDVSCFPETVVMALCPTAEVVHATRRVRKMKKEMLLPVIILKVQCPKSKSITKKPRA